MLELLAPAGDAVARRMFGGYGVYLDGLFVGIILRDTLYLKADDATRGAFDAAGCAPFTYARNGKSATLGFRQAPGEALDAPHLMRPWARLAVAAALRSRAAKPARENAAGRARRPAGTAKRRKP